MLDVEHDCLLQFVEAVLNGEEKGQDTRDDNGISEHAYLRLRQLADSMHECPDHAERSHRIEGILDSIEATDGRFYLPKED